MTPPNPSPDVAGMLALADRCEKATGPDRELDGSIWWATLSPDAVEHFDRSGFVRECIERDGSAGNALAQFFDSANPVCLAKIAFANPYTASLDAAMTLLPDGYDWAVFRTNGGLTIHAWCGDRHDKYGETPALALCAAALRARAHLLASETPNAD